MGVRGAPLGSGVDAVGECWTWAAGVGGVTGGVGLQLRGKKKIFPKSTKIVDYLFGEYGAGWYLYGVVKMIP